jgi:hypothetical protein
MAIFGGIRAIVIFTVNLIASCWAFAHVVKESLETCFGIIPSRAYEDSAASIIVPFSTPIVIAAPANALPTAIFWRSTKAMLEKVVSGDLWLLAAARLGRAVSQRPSQNLSARTAATLTEPECSEVFVFPYIGNDCPQAKMLAR